jgi:nucleotide-binding universal stress UspA family protein
MPSFDLPVMRGDSILVPVDFSREAEMALRWASALAGRLGMAVDLLHVEAEVLPADVTHLGVAIAQRRHASEAANKLGDWMRAFVPESCRGQVLVKSGQPADKILETAGECAAGLIVISWHHRDKLKRIFLGSTTEQLLEGAKFPVVVLPSALFEKE